ncbi:SulP family inorganic anion transporter [Peredibacter sp. HCB2-198]|uniref:SulP family inorganic anion transporter n=1 Tax=Peredibacter sp. HCB2-198 TaxID=3383025 RepID=UPI0038B5C0D0
MPNLNNWKQDIQASLVVFLVALPLCLGIALASGAPLASGLIAGIVGGLVVGSVSGSGVSVSGPAAGLTVIVAAAIIDIGNFQGFTLAVVLSGVMQIIFSFVKGGKLGDYFPSSVIKGMLAAIGLILILKQFPHAIGFDSDFMGDQSFAEAGGRNTFSAIAMAIEAVHPGSILVALISVLIMLAWEKGAYKGNQFFKIIPGALVAVVTSVIINEVFKLAAPGLVIESSHLVQLPFSGGVKDFVAGLAMPDWSYLSNPKIYVTAATIAVVGSIESLLSVEAADKIDVEGRITDKNRELLAQGCGNAISGLIGGLPVTAVIVRTSANVSAGAKTKLSAIFHGLWLMGCVIAIPALLNLIPLSCLASVLILVGYKLTKPEIIKKMYARGWNQFIPFAVTTLAILFTDLLVGIAIGMVVGFIFVIRSSMHASIVLVNNDEEWLIRFHKDVSFLQKSHLTDMLMKIPNGANVVIDGSKSIFVDDDIIDLIEDFMKRANCSDIKVQLKKSSLALSPIFKEE